jgi:hypothetical protein
MGVRASIILMLISVLIFMGDVIYRAITRSSTVSSQMIMLPSKGSAIK